MKTWQVVGLGILLVTAAYGYDDSLQEETSDETVITPPEPAPTNEANPVIPDIEDRIVRLHQAAQAADLNAVRLLVEQGVDLNAPNSAGVTPLHIAALNGSLNLAELLLAHGAAVQARDRYGLTPLHLATQYGHVELIRLLLDRGAELEARTNDRGLMPLHWMAFFGHTEGLATLLEYGADINARDYKGDTPLTWAEAYDHEVMARLLWRKGGRRHNP